MATSNNDRRRGSQPVTNTCPDWCRCSAADHEKSDQAEPWLHQSRPMGRFEFWQLDGEPMTATLAEGIGHARDLTVADLRAIAADALAAAEWMEVRA